MKECVNCGTPADTTYCHSCGQKMEVKRVTFKNILGEFFSKWIGFDNQFARTIIDMAIKPGVVINSYLKGNRTKYIGPLGFLIIMTALLIISFDLFGLEVQDFIEENQSSIEGLYGANPTENQLEAQQKVNEFMARNFRFFSTIMIPFWGISLWVFYREAKLNYIERTAVAIYMSCQGMWLTVIMLGLFAITYNLYNLPILIISIFYYAYCLNRVFSDKNYFISLLKALGSLAIAFFTMIFFAIIIGLVIGIVVAINNPEILQQQG